ncbi:hypothetical protein V1511DRAFT_502460 [Dipodascopsis uninucleata]
MKSTSLLRVLGVIGSLSSALASPVLNNQITFQSDNENESPITEEQMMSVPYVDTEVLQSMIKLEELEERAKHLFSLAERSIPDYGHPTRVIGSKGHEGTIEYIVSEMKSYGYDVHTQAFQAVNGRINSFNLTITKPDSGLVFDTSSAETLSLSPSTKDKQLVTGQLKLVKNQGCFIEDYSDVSAGDIAFIIRGTCTFGQKSLLAGKVNASAALIYNSEHNDDGLHGTLGEPSDDAIASLGISYNQAAVIIEAMASSKIIASAIVDSDVGYITTRNVIADTTLDVCDDESFVVMLGAHTDSVFEGPGINDDGSGTISLLTVAKALSEIKSKLKHCVRFGFWAAEEEGLLGSNFYAFNLTQEEKDKIALFMDYDMMASPNFAYQVYDANNFDHPIGSQEIKDLYIDWYTSHNLSYTLEPFDGRSDYDGFVRVGIAAGGIATGAEKLKTQKEVEMFGGEVGVAYDKCYHQLCDDLSNPNYKSWIDSTQLIAHSVAIFADDLSPFKKQQATLSTYSYVPSLYKGPHLQM